eukprot:3653159-Lingulodinium_polyedra.AAC.1
MQHAANAKKAGPAASSASAGGASSSSAQTPIDGTWNYYVPPARVEKPKKCGQNKATPSMMGPARGKG